MGGGDKSLLPLKKGTVLGEVIERLAPQADPIVLSANGDPSRFAAFGLSVMPDRYEGFHGPLAGIEAGLGWVRSHCAGTSFAVTVPGNTPVIPADLVARLAEGKDNAPMAVAVSQAGLHPVVGLWPAAMADALADALARGGRRASQFVRDQGAAEVSFPPATIARTEVDPFFNINTPEDLDYARTLAARHSGSADGLR
jgi:molybdopterin-guanine dinucleotide biosynthesis protein A